MYLGVDLGTSSIKILLGDNNGNIIDSQSVEYPIEYPQEGWSQQNPTDWWNGFCTVTTELGKRHDLTKLKTICFSGQMHGLVLLDDNDEVIRPALLWNDGRTVEQCRYLNEDIGMDKLVAWTGNMALTGFTAPKVLWVRDNEPDNFARIAKIMLPKDYLQYMISGVFASDVSDNSGTLYFDVANKCWSEPMLDILGITTAQLPASFESYEAVGTVSASVAAKLGLSTETKLVIGGGDQAMGAVGTGTITSGSISVSLGTSGVVFVNADTYVEDKKASLHSFCHANGNYHLMGVTMSCAGSTKWWAEDVLGTKDYANLFAGLSEGEVDNLLYLPYLIGERSPINDPFAKGCMYGLSVMHDQKAMTKAVLEGICFSLRDCLDVARAGGVNPQFARVIGGGAKSPDWLQLLADIMNVEIRTINTNEGGGLGAIILGMVADGKYASVAEACGDIIKETATYSPRTEYVAKYTEKFGKYKALYNAVKSL